MSAPINTADYLHSKLRMLPHIEKLSTHIYAQIKVNTPEWAMHKVCDIRTLINDMSARTVNNMAYDNKEHAELRDRSMQIVHDLLHTRVSSIHDWQRNNPEEVFKNFNILPDQYPREIVRYNVFAYTISPMGIDFFVNYKDDFGNDVTAMSFLSLGWIESTQIVQNNPNIQGAPTHVQ